MPYICTPISEWLRSSTEYLPAGRQGASEKKKLCYDSLRN